MGGSMSTEKIDIWMPVFIGDYHASTPHLQTHEHGAYLLLMMAYWRNGGRLPDDDKRLAAIAKATPREWKNLRTILAEFFRVEDGFWVQKRLDVELIKAQKNAKTNADRAKKAASKRWGKDPVNDAPSITQATLDDCPSPSPLPKNKTNAAECGGISTTPQPPADAGRSQQRTQIDPEFSPDEASRQLALSHGLDVANEVQRFVLHFTGNGNVQANWQSRFSKWLLDAVAYRDEKQQRADRPPRPGSKEAIREAYLASMEESRMRLGLDELGEPIERDITPFASRVLDDDEGGQ